MEWSHRRESVVITTIFKNTPYHLRKHSSKYWRNQASDRGEKSSMWTQRRCSKKPIDMLNSLWIINWTKHTTVLRCVSFCYGCSHVLLLTLNLFQIFNALQNHRLPTMIWQVPSTPCLQKNKLSHHSIVTLIHTCQ